jgi:CRISPR/Cas system CMR subunit Cmr6 (Cas7 group RAMP superfamily)
LAIESGSKFVVLYKGNTDKGFIKNLLKEGLTIFGLGAKKRKGYGQFKV